MAGIAIGAIAGMNPFYTPHITPGVGIAALGVNMILMAALSINPIAARVGVLVSGLFFVVPCFLLASPLMRGSLMCMMAFPFALVVLPLYVPATTGFRERMAYFFTWLGTREVKRCRRRFETGALLSFLVSTAIVGGCIACVKVVSSTGLWLLVRWIAGGIMLLAWAESVTASHVFLAGLLGVRGPALMNSPYLSVSMSEFWANRWNPAASAILYNKLCFAPLARRGVGMAAIAAFFFSGLAHWALFYMATGVAGTSVMCGVFFLVQPIFIFAERRMAVRRWSTTAARAWTIGALMVSSPLFVEPALELFERCWGPSDAVLFPALFAAGYALGMNILVGLGYYVFCPVGEGVGTASPGAMGRLK